MTDWQPIETAPRDGTAILVYSPRHGVATARWVEQKHKRWRETSPSTQTLDGIDDFSDFHGTTGDGFCIYGKTLTHWMPLPPPPKTEGAL